MQLQDRVRHDRSSLRVVKYRDETPTFPTYSPAEAGLMRAGPFAFPEPRIRRPSSIKRPAPPQDLFKSGSEAVRTPSRDTRWWRAATAAMFGLTARVAGEFHTRNEIAFSGVLLAIMFWTIRQILAGCAAYAQAIYPHPVCVDLDQPVDRDGTQSGSPPERSGKQNRPLKASDISPGTGDESRNAGRLLQWRQARLVAHDGPRRDVPRDVSGHGARHFPGHGDLCG